MKCASAETKGILPSPVAKAIQKVAPCQGARASRDEALLLPANPHHTSATDFKALDGNVKQKV